MPTCRVIASVLEALKTFDEDFKNLTASPWNMVVKICKDSFGQKKTPRKVSTVNHGASFPTEEYRDHSDQHPLTFTFIRLHLNALLGTTQSKHVEINSVGIVV